ncbi:NADPH:quinone reductase-like Zn-dependent oxidoreductase [Yoonia maricola]|uniref:NADPH:quinone reductase-like Zn-dependent oxidoreductase n=1 Tax=Yoonia maricola TaxID=420999 RepID=A0A2M8WQ07_9RHOB|nr:alcohol dehydrogenase family protein [Yoonia maricola]PJI93012.1 NADPH:quinone reductase-like Zn-dependent oxidoreductase [Yoonia maricola]
MKPETMRGVALTGHGGPECLEWREDLPRPAPMAGEVLIRVAAAGVNNTDINTRVGWYSKGDNDAGDASWAGAPLRFPRVQGIDVCGHIVAVGSGADPAQIGARVLVEPCLTHAQGQMLARPWFLGSECDGGFAEYCTVAARHAYAISSPLSDVELASFPCSYSTAENMLTRTNLRDGETVLITGASGGVGSAAVQLAKARGAQVAVITRASKAQSLRDLGADIVVDRDANDVQTLGADSIDVVVDLVAGDMFPRLLNVLRPKGRYAVAGAVGGPMVSLDVRTLYLKDLSFFGCTALEQEVFGKLIKRIETGAIKPLVGAVFPLKDISAAQRAFAEKNYTGKVVLTVADDKRN